MILNQVLVNLYIIMGIFYSLLGIINLMYIVQNTKMYNTNILSFIIFMNIIMIIIGADKKSKPLLSLEVKSGLNKKMLLVSHSVSLGMHLMILFTYLGLANIKQQIQR